MRSKFEHVNRPLNKAREIYEDGIVFEHIHIAKLPDLNQNTLFL